MKSVKSVAHFFSAIHTSHLYTAIYATRPQRPKQRSFDSAALVYTLGFQNLGEERPEAGLSLKWA